MDQPEQEPPPGIWRPVVKRPRFGVFILSGVVVGVVLAAVVTLVFGRPEGRDGVDYGLFQVFGYLAVILGMVGALVGGLVASIAANRAERRRRRQAARR